ncbi:uncharacterized protein [Erythrolamprus reginae]|uniref:uncharacterized protein n=1 Tax=Erythrolamprus reginae TaxID=121349 RepID=UPI00396CD77A
MSSEIEGVVLGVPGSLPSLAPKPRPPAYKAGEKHSCSPKTRRSSRAKLPERRHPRKPSRWAPTEHLHVQTPLRESIHSPSWLASKVYLKLECAQPTSSFKIRGIGNFCKTLVLKSGGTQTEQLECNDEKILVEPACGAALAIVYSGRVQKLQAEGKLTPRLDSLVVIVCGGNNITLAQLNRLKAQLGLSTDEEPWDDDVEEAHIAMALWSSRNKGSHFRPSFQPHHQPCTY